MSSNRDRVLLISGPTASGKSSFAINLAQRIGGEIISVDSVQVYCGLDIGSAKPPATLRQQIPHHLIDIRNPDQEFNAGDFVREVLAAITDILHRGRVPILCGGTTMYLSALLSGLSALPKANSAMRREFESLDTETLYQMLVEVDDQAASAVHRNDRLRISRALEIFQQSGQSLAALARDKNLASATPTALALVLCPKRDELYQAIERRSAAMINAGLTAEVQGIIAKYGANIRALQTIGYKQVLQHLASSSQTDLAAAIAMATRRYAKRQMTFWRNEPGKRGWIVRPSTDENRIFVGAESGQARDNTKRLGFFAYDKSFDELASAVEKWWRREAQTTEVWYVGGEARLAVSRSIF